LDGCEQDRPAAPGCAQTVFYYKRIPLPCWFSFIFFFIKNLKFSCQLSVGAQALASCNLDLAWSVGFKLAAGARALQRMTAQHARTGFESAGRGERLADPSVQCGPAFANRSRRLDL